MQKLSQYNVQKIIDLLSERLTFERSSVRLYDSVLAKMGGSGDPFVATLLPDMKEHRNQEAEHAEWLEQQISALGGDASEKTDLSRLVEVESKGLEDVILAGDSNIPHQFHALLAAELFDNAGWELLLELADEADDPDARGEFKKRLHEEEDHLMLVRRAVESFAAATALGLQSASGTAP